MTAPTAPVVQYAKRPSVGQTVAGPTGRATVIKVRRGGRSLQLQDETGELWDVIRQGTWAVLY